MLRDHLGWFNFAEHLKTAMLHCRDEGRDITPFEEMVEKITNMDYSDPQTQKKAMEVMKEMESLPVSPGFPYNEPSDLQGIKAQRPKTGGVILEKPHKFGESDAYDHIYGAWLGRCAGCLLGQPLEGAMRGYIVNLLKDTGNYPFSFYIDSSKITPETREKYEIIDVLGPNRYRNWVNNVNHMPEDDDTNYTVIGLKILEEFGAGFTPENVAESWLRNLPILHVCSAESIAYRNVSNWIFPPESATYLNPFREWIGAQMRGDFYGYINPGNPEPAAEMAWRDASISHVKNGIYGEMFVAAALAAAAITDDITAIITAGLSQIPVNSRFTEDMKAVLQWKAEGLNWEQSIDRIHEKYDETLRHHAVHTLPNAMIVGAGLIFGELDFEKSIGIAVAAGFDTDCNGATVGSIVGMALGATKLPEKWIKPLNDTLKSGVDGFGLVKISELAKRTVDIAKNTGL